MTAKQTESFIQKINTANTIVIFMHNNPDGDAIGSAGALLELIKINTGKTASLLYSGTISKSLLFLPHAPTAINIKDLSTAAPFDLAIAVDTGSLSLLSDGNKDLFLSARDTVKIDHHKDSDNFANLNIKTVCAATAELIYTIARHAKWSVNTSAANALYTAILSDTMGFKFVKKSSTFKIAAALVDRGAGPAYIAEQLSKKTKASTLVNAAAVMDAKFFFNDELALTTIDKQQKKNLDGKGTDAMTMLQNIDGVNYVALLKEYDTNDVHLSLRGKKPVDVVAHEFGGAGHELAAGATLTGTLDQACESVLRAFEKILQRKQ